MITILLVRFAKPLFIPPLLLVAFRHIKRQIRWRRRWRPRLRMRSRRLLSNRALISHIRFVTRTFRLAAGENARRLLFELPELLLILLPLLLCFLFAQRDPRGLLSRSIRRASRAEVPRACRRRWASTRCLRGETSERGLERFLLRLVSHASYRYSVLRTPYSVLRTTAVRCSAVR